MERVELEGGYLEVGDAQLWCGRRSGHGIPVVFVHGSLDDHRTWERCLAHLPLDVPAVAYDRRGHTRSTAPDRQGVIGEDVADLVAVLADVGVPAVVVGHSYGATVALLAALEHLEHVAAVVAYEPPIFGVLRGRPEYADLIAGVTASMAAAAELIAGGQAEAGVQLFVEEVAFGPGAWERVFTADTRAVMVANAGTWLDQYRDPQRLALAPDRLGTARCPVAITSGTNSLPAFGASLDLALAAVPTVERRTIVGAAHAAPHTHPGELVDLVLEVRARLS